MLKSTESVLLVALTFNSSYTTLPDRSIIFTVFIGSLEVIFIELLLNEIPIGSFVEL